MAGPKTRAFAKLMLKQRQLVQSRQVGTTGSLVRSMAKVPASASRPTGAATTNIDRVMRSMLGL